MAGTGRKLAKRPKRVSPQTKARMVVVEEMLRALIPMETIKARQAKEWGITELAVKGIIDNVYDQWAIQANDPQFVSKQKNTLRESWKQIHIRALAKNDLHQAGRALEHLGKLDGCYPDEKLKVEASLAMTGVGINLTTLGFSSPEEVRARIDELRARIAKGGVEAVTAGVANSQLMPKHSRFENPGMTTPFLDVLAEEEAEIEEEGLNGNGEDDAGSHP